MRSGESAEAIASDTGWALDKVLRYAEPLLAERTFMANQAQTVEVRRSGGRVSLYEACEQVLGETTTDGVQWDAHRRDDGRWIVTANVDGDVASWTYDHHGRNLHPLDELARRLMGATPAPVEHEVDIAEALDLAGDVPVVRETKEARPRLAVVPAAAEDPAPDTAASETAEASGTDAESPSSPGYQQETITLPREQGASAGADSSVPGEKSQPASASKATKGTPRKAKGRKGRTSVPSWDEILFGAGRSDD